MLAQSGCRAAEASALQIRNVDMKEMRALVDGKGDVRRLIYLDRVTVQAIEAWLEERPQTEHDYLFVSIHDGSPLTSAAVSQVIRRLSKKARLKRSLGPHSLRHRVGLKMARAHIAPRVTQHYLGHRDIKITLTYYQDVDEEDLFKAGEFLVL